MKSKPQILVIVGPTASGKTALSIALAKKFDGEIVSADSRQIYRGMDIGTAKPPKKEQAGIPHHLIDIKNPNEPYTLADYKRDAIRTIRSILKKDKLPILVGGTGLYVDAVVDNLDIPAVKSNEALRKRLEARAQKEGLDTLFRELVERDPEAAYIVDPRNPRRVIRALEVALVTGRPFSAQRRRKKPLFEVLALGLNPPREALNAKIDRRVDSMIKKGLTREVRSLIARYGPQLAAFDAIGYREVISHLEGKTTPEEMAALIKRNTRNYAKRQMTWFRRDSRIHWVRNQQEAAGLVKVMHIRS